MSVKVMYTYVEETVFVHVSKHLYDVSCTEGQLSLNTVITNKFIRNKTYCYKYRVLCVSVVLSGVYKPHLYVSVRGAFSWIVIKDGDHPACSWGRVPCSCSSLAVICKLNTEIGRPAESDILIIRRGRRVCNSNEPISMQLIVSACQTYSAPC